MSYQKLKRAGLIDGLKEMEIRNKLQNIQKIIEPVKVINPYAPLIELPENIKTQRRMLPILLSFIEAITFYHQYQRIQLTDESTGEIYIETEPSDIVNGFKYLRDVLFRKSDELNGAVRNFYEKLVVQVSKLEQAKFKISAVRSEIKIPPRTIQHYIKVLIEYGYMERVGGKSATGYEYEIITQKSKIELEKAIEQHINEVMERVQKQYDKKHKTSKSKAS